jgi:stress-induced-phosphoprotein 1
VIQIRADFKLIAKALGRVGTAYAKKGEYGDAIKWYEKSLTEHRTADVLAKLKEVGFDDLFAEGQTPICLLLLG